MRAGGMLEPWARTLAAWVLRGMQGERREPGLAWRHPVCMHVCVLDMLAWLSMAALCVYTFVRLCVRYSGMACVCVRARSMVCVYDGMARRSHIIHMCIFTHA